MLLCGEKICGEKRIMIQEYQIRILPEQAANEQSIKLFISKDKGIDARTIQAIRVLKRSIDARQRTRPGMLQPMGLRKVSYD